MSEAELDTLSVAAIRTAIREKLGAGTDRQTITLLIGKYVPSARDTTRLSDGVYRLPIEMIPLTRRTAFLDELNELPGHATDVALNFGIV